MRVVGGTPEAAGLRVFDRDTSDEIEDVMWADPETGEYAVLARDEEGFLMLAGDRHDLVVEHRTGNIELRKPGKPIPKENKHG